MQYINNFRGISILLVMLVHSISVTGSSSNVYFSLIEYVLNNITISFVFIAGLLFTYTNNKFNYSLYLKLKFNNVVFPYIIISIPAVLLYVLEIETNHYWIDMDWFNSLNMIQKYLMLMSTGAHLGPLWFVPMIIIYYIISPLFYGLMNRDFIKYIFIISLVSAIYLGRPEYNENVIQSAIYFLPAYLLGIIFSKITIHQYLIKYSAWFFSLFLSIYFILFYNSVDISSSIDLVLKLIGSLCLIFLCKRYLYQKNMVLGLFARLSFYLFFVHGYVIGGLRMLVDKVDGIPVGIIITTSFVVVVIVSIASFVIIKLIFNKNSKKIIGV